MEQRGQYAIVTGGGSGLGYSIAIELAKRGYHLFLVARNEPDLQAAATSIMEIFGVNVKILACDLSLETCRLSLFNICEKEKLEVAILVNNAGYAIWGNFDRLSLHDQLTMMQVNMNAVVHLCHFFIPILKSSKSGFILNVGSSSSFQALPTLGVYAASKSFIRNFTRSLMYELKGSGIHVSCLLPGPVKTGFIIRAGMKELQKDAALLEMLPEKVAAIAIRKMFEKKVEIIPGIMNKLHYTFSWLLPLHTLETILGRTYQKHLAVKEKGQ